MKSVLKAGHGGIFQVMHQGRVVSTNAGKCGSIPKNEDVIAAIREARDETSGPATAGGCSGAMNEAARDSGDSPCCP